MAMSELDWMDIFANNLRDILAEANMSQRELADAIGVTEAAVSKYIHGRTMPSVKALNNMAHILDVDIYDILYFGDMVM